MTERATISIDGKEIACEPGELLIKVAQDHGIYIPRFCWHERMKPVGMCRMCLVEIEGVKGLPPACTTPVKDGMVVRFAQDNVEKAQDGVLEFLLINHPLDCPVCDRGGECPLQDQTLAFGPGESRFVEEKRHFVKPIEISDHVLLDRERCIQCARCTRFADEIAGDPLITFVDRGDETQVLNFPDEPFASYFSGNTVQICPVGALTAKPYRFRARPWDLDTVETSCLTCSVQCRGALQSSSNRLVRLLGVDSEPVNHGWLCDKGRYGLEWVHAPTRVRVPQVRVTGELEGASWPEALERAAGGIRKAIELHGPTGIGVLGGARLTNEGAYAWARLAKGVWGTDNVDAQLGDGLPGEAVLGLPPALISDLDRARAIVLMGPDTKEELPVLYLRLRRAAVELGVPLIDLASHGHGLTPYASEVARSAPGESDVVADRLVAAFEGNASGDPAVDAAADLLSSREGDVVVVLGRQSLAERPEPTLRAANALRRLPGARFLVALRRGNVRGAMDLGLTPGFLPGRVGLDAGREWYAPRWGRLPEEPGLDAAGIVDAAASGRLHTLVLLGSDPFADFPDRARVRDALSAVPFTIAIDGFFSESNRRADVFLPVTLWGESGGSATNVEGRVQRLAQKVSPEGVALDDWRVAAELARRTGDGAGTDFGWATTDDVTDEIAATAPAYAGIDAALLRRARDGAVAPIDAFPDEIVVSTAEAGGAPSWEPIKPMPAEVVAEVTANDGAESGLEVEDSGTDDGAAERTSADAPAEVDRPGVYAWGGPVDATPSTPQRDAYALRLVTGRTLYDDGRIVSETPATAGLGGRAELRVHRSDRDRIGVADGDRVRVTTSRGSFTLVLRADPEVASGTAFVAFNRTLANGEGPKHVAADLIDASDVVTDLRVESL